MARHHIHPTAKIGELANRQVLSLTTALTHMKIENDLKRQVLNNIKRLKDSGTYRGRRHAINLPVRGQNTRTQVWLVMLDLFCYIMSWRKDSVADIPFLFQHKTALKLNRIDRKL